MAAHDWREAPSEGQTIGGMLHVVYVCSKCGWLMIRRYGSRGIEVFYKPQGFTLNPYAIKEEPPCPPPEYLGSVVGRLLHKMGGV